MSTKFMTPTELKRNERNTKIYSEFERLVSENPEVSRNRLINHISSKFGLTSTGVRKILDDQQKS